MQNTTCVPPNPINSRLSIVFHNSLMGGRCARIVHPTHRSTRAQSAHSANRKPKRNAPHKRIASPQSASPIFHSGGQDLSRLLTYLVKCIHLFRHGYTLINIIEDSDGDRRAHLACANSPHAGQNCSQKVFAPR